MRHVPTAKFFALRGIKESLVNGYAVLGLNEAISLRDELYQFAVAASRQLESFVLDSLCWVIAVITKRAWIDSSEEQRMLFTRTLCEDITVHNTPCIGLITATYLIDEISGGSKCSEFNLPWEFHYMCKASFEKVHLMYLFEAALKVMHRQLQRSLAQQSISSSGSHTIAYERRSALHVAERVLNWAFTSLDANKLADSSFGGSIGALSAKNSASSGSDIQGRARSGDLDGGDDYEAPGLAILDSDLRSRTPLFPTEWQSLLLDSSVVGLFFSIYEATVSDQMHMYFSPGSSHIALQCMIQISGLRGKGIFAETATKSTDSMRADYANTIMQSQLRVLHHVCTMDFTSEASEDLVVTTTQMIRRFIEAQLDEQPVTMVAGERLHPLALLAAGVPETFGYFGEVSKFICLLLRAASGILKSDEHHDIDEEFGDMDNYFVMQAFDELASAWTSVINEIREWGYLVEASLESSDKAKISASSGGATTDIEGRLDNQNVLKSFTQFLTSTACMIRSEYIQLRMLVCEDSVKESSSRNDAQSIDHSLLAKDYIVYEDQLQFFGLLARLDIRTSIDRIYESLCSRCSALQSEFNRLESAMSNGTYASASDESTQRSIDILHEQIHWIVLLIGYTLADSGNSERVLIPSSVSESSLASHDIEHDCVVQSVVSILKTLQFELMSPSSILAAYGSPLLVETLFWALRRIVPVYFMVEMSDYRHMSPHIVSAFGRPADGGNGIALIESILEFVRRAFDLWTAEEDVLQMCVDMLLAFSQRSSIARPITQSIKFSSLMLYFTSNISRFPVSIHGSMVEALASLCSHSSSEDHERAFLELKSLILMNIAQVVQDPDFNQHREESQVISRLLDGLDMLDGIVSSANFTNMHMVFDLLFEVQPFFEQMLSIYPRGQEIPCKVIQIFESATRYCDISSLPDNEQMTQFSLNVRAILQKYQQSQDVIRTSHPDTDMDTLSRITTLTLAISHLVRNEMGFAPNELERSISQEVSDSFGETEIFGLYCLHTTATDAQITTPTVMRVYMQLLSELVQFRLPSMIRWLPAATWQAVMNMLLAGIDNNIYDVEQRTYEAINKLGAYIKIVGIQGMSPELQQIFQQSIQQFLSKLFSALLFSPFDSQLVEPAGTALVILGLIDSEHMKNCFQNILQDKSAMLAERLTAVFANFNRSMESCEAIRLFLHSSGPIPEPIDSVSLRQPLFEFLVSARAVVHVK
ncbi:hypothetical protein LPJ64_003553 [Coemansia asiatica]|uniref:Exportin-1 C-terminal domain-containing protein n=1 Tax=Coemansia asiatica TaxID=1052880 RepID=A0A9W7XKV7_9FUNG|nr:hypothetical protein LPJ64_003553 [Coemansia asiatica]